MKKITLLFSFLFCCGILTNLNAQINLLKSENYLVEAKINLAQDQLSEINSTNNASLELKNGELDIIFPTIKNLKEQFYSVGLEISLDGKIIVPFQENLRGFYGEKLNSNESGSKRVTWMNLIDNYQQLEGLLKVTIKTELRGELEMPIDCNNPPVFSQKEKLRYYIAGGVGVAAIGVGQLFKNKSQKIYDDDYLTSLSLDEAQPEYDKANSNHHTYLILTYAGSAILLTDAVLYILRNRKHKAQMRLYKKFCNGNSLSVRPMIEFPSISNFQGASGVHFTFSF